MIPHKCGVCFNKPSSIFKRFFTNSNLHSAFLKLTNQPQTNKVTYGIFGKPELTHPSGYDILQKKAIDECEGIVKQICSPQKPTRKLVALFDDLSDTLCQVADLAEFVRHCHPDQAHSRAASQAYFTISDYVERLNTNGHLYSELLKSVTHGDDCATPLDEIDLRTARLFLFDFEQSGIHLDERSRSQFVRSFGEQIRYGTEFMEKLLRPVTTRGNHTINPSISKYLRISDEGGDGEFVVPQTYAHIDEAATREALYKLYYNYDPAQQRNLVNLLNARHSLARVAGFSSYAEKSVQNSLASSTADISKFIDKVNSGMRRFVNEDLDSLKMTYPHIGDKCLSQWDVEHYVGKAKADLCYLSHEMSNYFSLPDCIQGLNETLEALFGVAVRLEDILDGEQTWSAHVFKLGFYRPAHGNPMGQLLGHVYCDLFARPQKPAMDCHFTIRGGRGTSQTPIIVVSLNLAPVHDMRRCLLPPTALENFYHEMGHAVHSILGRTRYQHVTGTRCSTDFAEVPSNLLELYATDPGTLQRLGRHAHGRQAPPHSLVRAYLGRKRAYAALDYQTQIYYSALDQALHGRGEEIGDESMAEVVKDTAEAYSIYPYVAGTAPHLLFGHIVGYGAKYYSYLVAKSVAQCLWQEYFSPDPFSALAGQKFLLLVKDGGERHPRDIIQRVLGHEKPVEIMDFSDSIVAELGKNWDRV